MPGIYSYDSAEKLFEKLKKDFSDFCHEPSEDGVYGLIFPLYHLREWIHPEGHKTYKNKSEESLSKEEHLHKSLHGMEEYEIIRALCNNAKHFNDFGIADKTRRLEGARFGLARHGDRFGITHFLIDGVEIRDIFWSVYISYLRYFQK